MSAPHRTRRTLAQSKREGVASERGRFLRLDDMIASTGLSESTIRRKVKKGEMPPTVALTARCVGWWEGDYAAWAASRRGASSSN